MSNENPAVLQNQIRENADELQDFLRDLDSWEKEMKKKEEELKLIQTDEGESVPPVRNTLLRSKKKKRQPKSDEDKLTTVEKPKQPKPPKLSGYDYKGWEKYDVESELKKSDEEAKKSNTSDSEKEEEFLTQKKQQMAIIKKDKGNAFFKKGSYDSAINCYTAGMELDPENPILPANRAMAFLKKEQYQAAENDCTTCLLLDSTYVKAFLRRGTARTALEKYSLAKRDFLRVLELEPDNKQAQLELEKLEKLRVKMEVKPSNTVDKKTDKTSLKNISESNKKPKLLAEIMSPVDVNSKKTPDPPSANLPIKSATNVNNASSSESSSKSVLSNEMALSEIESVISALERTMPDVPTTSFQFLSDWKKLSKYTDLKYKYLKQFPPDKFPVIFKCNMEAEIFSGILNTLSTQFIQNQDDVLLHLKYLSQVGRFTTMMLFLSENERKAITDLSDYLHSPDYPFSYAPSEVETVLKKYKL